MVPCGTPQRQLHGATLMVQDGAMSQISLKEHLRSDLTASMKAQDKLRTATLRMALTAITNEEVSGKESRTLSDSEVITVLGREAKKRREAAEAFDAVGRTELADQERNEQAVLVQYLPIQLTDSELVQIVTDAIDDSGASGMGGMGAVMKIVQPKVAGQADGGRVAAEVRRQLD